MGTSRLWVNSRGVCVGAELQRWYFNTHILHIYNTDRSDWALGRKPSKQKCWTCQNILGMSRRMSNYRECDKIEKNSRTARRTRWMRGYHLLLGTLLVVTPGSDGIIPNFAPQKTSYYCTSGQRRTTAGLQRYLNRHQSAIDIKHRRKEIIFVKLRFH